MNTNSLPWVEISVILVTIVITLVYLRHTFVRPRDDAAVPFTVPVPEQCKLGWQGLYLEHPEIKVETRSSDSSRLLLTNFRSQV